MSSRSRNYLLLACGMAVALSFGLQAVAPALPLIQDVFGVDDLQIGLITSAYVLPGVLFAVPLGVVADLFGRKPVFVAAGLFYGLMGLAQSFAPTFGWLLVWRLCQGFGFAALMPLTVTIIGDAFTGLAQVRAQARRQVVMAMGNLVVPVVGAQLALATWSLPFAAQTVTIIPALLALSVLDPGSGSRGRRAGYAQSAWTSVIRPGFPSVLLLGFVRFFARFSVIAFLPIQLTRELGVSLTTVGVITGMATGLGFLSAMTTARLAARFRPSRVVLGALFAIGLGMLGYASFDLIGLVVLATVVYAFGDGVVSVLQSAYAARGAPDDVRAGLVAVNGTARNAGKFLGPLIVGVVASWAGIPTGLALVGGVMIAAAVTLPRALSGLDEMLRSDDQAVTAV